VKFVNFIQARGLNHKQLISPLQDFDAEHTDVSYYTTPVCDRWSWV